jgi:hypothetical protein
MTNEDFFYFSLAQEKISRYYVIAVLILVRYRVFGLKAGGRC